MRERTVIRASDIDPDTWPPARWLLARPRLVDGMVIACSVVPQILALALGGGTQPVESWATVILAGVALWWRRSRPFPVLIALAAIATLHPATSVIVACACAAYTVAGAGPVARTIVAFAGSLSISIASVVARHLVGAEVAWPTSVVDPVVLVAFGLGFTVRASRDRRATVQDVLEQRMENARQLERTRIATEMHDIVAHSLSVIVALADGAAASRISNPSQSAIAVGHLAAVSRSALIEMQNAIRVLRDSDEKLDHALDSSGHNVPPLDELVEVLRAAHLPVVLVHDGEEVQLPPVLRTAVYRIAQEALTNALRYATGATRVELRLERTRDDLVMVVRDDGRADGSVGVGTGQGLVGIRERVVLLRGEMHAGPRRQGGWEVHVTIPIDPRSSA